MLMVFSRQVCEHSSSVCLYQHSYDLAEKETSLLRDFRTQISLAPFALAIIIHVWTTSVPLYEDYYIISWMLVLRSRSPYSISFLHWLFVRATEFIVIPYISSASACSVWCMYRRFHRGWIICELRAINEWTPQSCISHDAPFFSVSISVSIFSTNFTRARACIILERESQTLRDTDSCLRFC